MREYTPLAIYVWEDIAALKYFIRPSRFHRPLYLRSKQREAEATARAEATTATGQRILPGHRQDAHSSHTYASLWGIIGRQTN
ncbi:hypothetical protein V1478_008253 [Vespula squamosa]|uniref:Uncharacterized protein n=1 Tax=Vespula squamosa TaxID=30214 RepID=A0ABD2AYM8_VESSQ